MVGMTVGQFGDYNHHWIIYYKWESKHLLSNELLVRGKPSQKGKKLGNLASIKYFDNIFVFSVFFRLKDDQVGDQYCQLNGI